LFYLRNFSVEKYMFPKINQQKTPSKMMVASEDPFLLGPRSL